MLYFAYGSNMDEEQMSQRCPSSTFYGVATLPEHRLAFTRYSKGRGCGVADCLPAKGSEVWGVVYDITETDLSTLDRSEGYLPGRANNAYIRENRQIFMNGDQGRPETVAIYFACRQDNPPLPSPAYKAQIIKGARFWLLPEMYIQEVLEAVVVDPD